MRLELWSFKCQRKFSDSNLEFNILQLAIQNLDFEVSTSPSNFEFGFWNFKFQDWFESLTFQYWILKLEVQSFRASKMKFWNNYFEVQILKLWN